MQFNGHTLMLLLSATVARCNFEHQQSPAAAATEIKGSFYLLSAYSFKVLRLYEIHSSNRGRYYYVITASDLIEFSLFFSYYQPVSSVLRLSFYAFLVQSNHSTQLPHAMVIDFHSSLFDCSLTALRPFEFLRRKPYNVFYLTLCRRREVESIQM